MFLHFLTGGLIIEKFIAIVYFFLNLVNIDCSTSSFCEILICYAFSLKLRRCVFLILIYRQDAILAAISEKDAHIALLELAPNQRSGTVEEVEKLTKEKQRSQQQLKELVCNDQL